VLNCPALDFNLAMYR